MPALRDIQATDEQTLSLQSDLKDKREHLRHCKDAAWELQANCQVLEKCENSHAEVSHVKQVRMPLGFRVKDTK